ncbi:hypothetical protein L1987_51207 [Smallanthus sonchifolius]|uniref:Uncharacterized protein n=1 Tax=Smallanthus sonchifolius TaxID=185202 RepID=A0ACB9EP24_9ASTR|nr:hypothetical protein L1987_51207 [Smallanthus sonchifolius]
MERGRRHWREKNTAVDDDEASRRRDKLREEKEKITRVSRGMSPEIGHRRSSNGLPGGGTIENEEVVSGTKQSQNETGSEKATSELNVGGGLPKDPTAPLIAQPFSFPLPNSLDLNSDPSSPACHNAIKDEVNCQMQVLGVTCPIQELMQPTSIQETEELQRCSLMVRDICLGTGSDSWKWIAASDGVFSVGSLRSLLASPASFSDGCFGFLCGVLKVSRKERSLSKFVKNEYEKIGWLMELYMRYSNKVKEESERPNDIELDDLEMDEDEKYNRKLESGFYFLQASKGKLSESDGRKLFQQLIDGVTYCHDKGVYHCNLKMFLHYSFISIKTYQSHDITKESRTIKYQNA